VLEGIVGGVKRRCSNNKVVGFLTYVKDIKSCLPGDEEDSLKLQLSLIIKVLDNQIFFPIIDKTLVETSVLL